MMKSPVLVVPELAQVPEAALANVYVFTNGVQPRGELTVERPGAVVNMPLRYPLGFC
jgi:hypothetical protein